MRYTMKPSIRKLPGLAAACAALALLALSACGGGGNSTPATPVTLVNGQAATAVIGQTSFTASTAGTTAATLNLPYGNATVDPATGNLYLADELNNRMLGYSGIPAASGASATMVLAQAGFTTGASGVSASSVWHPFGPVIAGGQMFFPDFLNNRVGIYGTLPASSPGTIGVVAGQGSKTANGPGCAIAALNGPESVSVAGGKMVVADTYNNRVLIWNTVPVADGAPADLVLGQPNMTTCTPNTGGAVTAGTLNMAGGVWTDGTRLVVLDSGNNRALVWNTFPTANGQVADLVLGQANFTSNGVATTAASLIGPYGGVFVNPAQQLFITDTGNNRVLVWNYFPASNGQAANVVLGQPDFTTGSANTTAATLKTPTGVITSGGHVIVTDSYNNRVLVY